MKLIVLLGLIVVATAAKTKKPIADYFTDFASHEDLHLITDDDDRPPTDFKGDVMKAKINSMNSQTGRGKYKYNFETQNGINIVSIGKLKNEKTFVVSGSYAYTGANGKRYRVRYTADEFGYHPITEEDNEPEIEIAAAPTPAPVSRTTISSSSFHSGNKFGKQDQNKDKLENNNNGYVIKKPSNAKNVNQGTGSNTGYGFNQGLSMNERFGSVHAIKLNSGSQTGNSVNKVNTVKELETELLPPHPTQNNTPKGNDVNSGHKLSPAKELEREVLPPYRVQNHKYGDNKVNSGNSTFVSIDRKSFQQNTTVLSNKQIHITKVTTKPSRDYLPAINRLYLPAAPTYLPPIGSQKN